MIIGSGFSGLCCGHFFKLMGLDFVIIEKGPSIGGTWYWNTYAGVEVDIPSFQYSFRQGFSHVFFQKSTSRRRMIRAGTLCEP